MIRDSSVRQHYPGKQKPEENEWLDTNCFLMIKMEAPGLTKLCRFRSCFFGELAGGLFAFGGFLLPEFSGSTIHEILHTVCPHTCLSLLSGTNSQIRFLHSEESGFREARYCLRPHLP